MRQGWRCPLVALALLCTLYTGGAQQHADVPGCEGKKIAVLDLSDLASIGNYPKCHLDEVSHLRNPLTFQLPMETSELVLTDCLLT